MTQAPKGEVILRTAAGEEALKLDHEGLYARSIRLFQDAGKLRMKGRDVESEIAEARRGWRFDLELIPSQSDPSGRIVSVKGLVRG